MYNAHKPPIRPEPPQQPPPRKKAGVVACIAVSLAFVLVGLTVGLDPLFWLFGIFAFLYQFYLK